MLIHVMPVAIGLSCSAASNDLQMAITAFPEVIAPEYRPDRAVDAANLFIKAGKEAACAALENAAKVTVGVSGDSHGNEQVCHLCRLLFTSASTNEPLRVPSLGASASLPGYSMVASNWPDLPFVIANGVPLSMNLGYGMVGFPERARDYLAYCEANGVFRTEPFLKPTFLTASNALVQVFNSNAWKALKWKDTGVGWHYTLDEEYAKERLWKQIQNLKE